MDRFENVNELFIEKFWNRDGERFYHHQVFNNGKVYIYEVGYSKDDKHWYEVFKRKVIADVEKIDGKIVTSKTNGHVKYPSNEDFGHWAKNCVSLTDAMQYAEIWS